MSLWSHHISLGVNYDRETENATSLRSAKVVKWLIKAPLFWRNKTLGRFIVFQEFRPWKGGRETVYFSYVGLQVKDDRLQKSFLLGNKNILNIICIIWNLILKFILRVTQRHAS